MGMTSDSVVKHFDVVDHIRLGQVAGFVDPLPPQRTAMLSSLDSTRAASGLTSGEQVS